MMEGFCVQQSVNVPKQKESQFEGLSGSERPDYDRANQFLSSQPHILVCKFSEITADCGENTNEEETKTTLVLPFSFNLVLNQDLAGLKGKFLL